MEQQFLKAINAGFSDAKGKVNNLSDKSNALYSSIFVHEVSKSIHQECFNNKGELKVIGVNEGGDKISGEWLLDSCIVSTEEGFIQQINFALESESAVSKKAFDEDFAKVIHINSTYRLYLNGLNQTTESGMKKYIKNRLLYAEKLLDNRIVDNLYIGFWPSTKQECKGKPSLWKCLGKYPHLNGVFLYKYQNGQFIYI